MHYTQEQAAPPIAGIEAWDGAPGAACQQIGHRDDRQTVLTARLGGPSPDICNVYSIWAAQMARNGVLAEAPPEIEAFMRDGDAPGSNSRDNASGVRPARARSMIWRRNSGG